jgi:hypothetical protein
MESKLTSQLATTPGGIFKTLALIGLIAGTLDGMGPIVVNGVNPAVMFKYIASGAFGADRAFSGGGEMIAWGVFFHYFIAFSWASLYFFSYPAVGFLRKNKFVSGTLYGIFVWIVMNRIVVPLSKIPDRPFELKGALIGVSILIIAIGLPIAILTERFYSKRGVDRG